MALLEPALVHMTNAALKSRTRAYNAIDAGQDALHGRLTSRDFDFSHARDSPALGDKKSC